MSARRRPFVVAVGGFDPSCGAGVVADARSIDAMGALPLAVVTAITVQSGSGVRSYRAVATASVRRQLDELLDHLPVAAIKAGQLPTPRLVRVLARSVDERGLPLVLDPVLVASGGGTLVERTTAGVIRSALVPLATLLTVNLHEAGVLTGRRVTGIEGMQRAAEALCAAGAAAVLVKGGHLRGDPVDVLAEGGHLHLLRARRLPRSMHGTGCALAAAAAARLAAGDDVRTAVGVAREHVRTLLKRAVQAGKARLRAPASY